jgi:hypothetical protein
VVPPATAVDADADGVAGVDALGLGGAEVPAAGVADADPFADGEADADADVDARPATGAFAVALDRGLVGVRVGAAVGAAADDCAAGGAAGAVPGGSAVPPFCQENATDPPAGTVSDPAATLEYFQPEVPSDQ